MSLLFSRLFAVVMLISAAGNHVLAADPRPLSPPCFGHAIAVHGDLLLVGAPHADNGRGQAYLFLREGTSHRLLEVVKRPRRLGNSTFGDHVALDLKTLVVGDSGASSAFKAGAGAAFLFDTLKVGEPVAKPQQVTPTQAERLAGFGECVAVHGDWVAVGESARNDGGSVTLFRRDGDQWTRESTINATQLKRDSISPAWFGKSVAMNRTTLVVGAPWTEFDERTRGAVFVYEKEITDRFDGTPTTLVWEDSRHHDFFGHDVAVGADLIVVGALLADIAGHEDAGAACVYVRGPDGRWPSQPTTVLKAAKPRKGAGFSSTLAVSGRRILVGTSKPDDGDYGVYVFEPKPDDDSTWTQVAHLEGTDESAGFGGWGLAATDALLYVGEPYAQPYGKHHGQVAVIAREEKEGKVTFRRIETIAMPE